MEVHHHSHTSRKNWTHYFWEFLMLFLAVFCGFFAEYQLEHKIEKNRETQYIQSLIEDLQTDTASLKSVIDDFLKMDRNMDTLLSLYPLLTVGYNYMLHRKLRVIKGFPDFVKADRTMQQLKNSGGMRLIRNKKAADGITEYDLMNRDLDIDVDALVVTFNQIVDSGLEILDSAGLAHDAKTKTYAEMEAGGKTYLLKADRQTLGKWNNQIRLFKMLCKMVRTLEEELREKAIELIVLLKKEYRLQYRRS
jgi:hypothetical protein